MPVCDLERLIADSESEVLETMFFSFVMGETEDKPSDPISTSLDFKGSPSGSFGVALSHTTSRKIAADFLAADETELTQTQVNEVICELTNMLCGTLLSRLESESSFELGHPKLAPVPDSQTYAHSFELDSGSLSVWLTLDEAT